MIHPVAVFCTMVLLVPAILGSGQDTHEQPAVQVVNDTERITKAGHKNAVIDSATRNSQDQPSTTGATAGSDEQQSKVPAELQNLLARLDALGRKQVRNATFVELQFSRAQEPSDTWTETAWLLSKDEKSITVLKDDLIPWIYHKDAPTEVPSSWQPASVTLNSISDSDFESFCRELRNSVIGGSLGLR